MMMKFRLRSSKPIRRYLQRMASKKLADPEKTCYCDIDPDYYRAETPAPWERVLGIPGIDKCRLQGNDSPEVLETSSIVMASLGPEFEKVLKCDDDDDVAKLDHPFDVINSLHTLAKTGQCELDTHRLLPMLKAAVEFKVNQLRQILGQYLVDNLTLDNALNTHALVQEYLCEHIRLKVVAFILVNFDQLSCSDKFLRNCPQDLLKEMLKEDRLNLDEKDLLLTLVRWASFNPPYRLCLQDLLLHLRFPIMPNSFLESVTLPGFLQEQLPQASPRELQSLESTLDTLSRRALKMVLPKYFRLPNEFILAVGGFHILPTHSVETLDVRAGEWSELAELQKIPCHAYHGLVFDQIGSKVYVIGGYGKATYYRSTHCLDLKTLKWTRKSSMRVKRCYVSTVALGSNIFAMGGFDGLVRSKSVEFFDPDTNQWENGPSMHIVRSDASAVVFKGKIIILGGFTGQEVLTSTEIYDPQKQEWTFGPRMSVARSGLKAVLLNNKIYAIGGYDGHERLSSVECLDLSKPGAEWTQVKRMITPRSNFGATVFQDRIVVAGGFDGNGVINLAEAYSEENNEWTSFPDLTITKSALNMISIKGLGNIEKYLKR